MTRRAGQQDALGLRLIVAYKFAKAGAELLLGALVLSLASAGLAGELQTVAISARDHATAAWSIALAEWLMQSATARNLHVIAVAALLDGVWTSFEGWALHRRYWWSVWLIVVATASLFPFEAIAVVRHAKAGRIALMIVNVLIVIYLVQSRMRARVETPA